MPALILDVPMAEVMVILDRLDPPLRRRKLSNLVAFNMMCYVLKYGIPWSELKWRMAHMTASPATVYKRFQKWTKAGVFEEVWRSVLAEYSRLHLLADAHWSRIINVDTSMMIDVCGQDCTGPNPTDRARKAIKISFVCD